MTPPVRIRFTPREWQRTALERWMQEQRGTASVVTGGGKTALALMCCEQMIAKYPHLCVFIVVPSLALLDQWVVSLEEDLGVEPHRLAIYSGEEKAEEPAQFNLLVLNTARGIASSLTEDVCSFLIVDECHRAGSPENSKALQGDHVATLGLSATPVREYDDGFTQYLVPGLGPVVFEYDYVQARRDGIVVPFDLANIRVPMTEDEATRYDQLTKKVAAAIRFLRAGTGSEEVVARLLQQRASVSASARARIPATVILLAQHRGSRALVFHERVSAANDIYEALKARGHSVTIYHSRIGPHIRRSNLRLYRQGLFDVLVTCRALDEGMNVPETTVAVIASGTASRRQRIQRLGRVLRPAPGKTAALVYTVYATEQELVRLQAESDRLEDVASTSWHEMSVT